MGKKVYRGHTIEFNSEQNRSGDWIARATIIIDGNKKIPIFGRRRTSFDTRGQADS